MGFYKKLNIEDERIRNIKNKIYSEIYILITVICLISIVAKYFIYGSSIETKITEIIILILSGAYYTYRSTKLGVYTAEVEIHDKKSKRSLRDKNLYIGIALGVGMALFFGINSAVRYAEGLSQSIKYFVMVTLVCLIMYLPFFLIILVTGHDVLKKKSDDAVNKMLGDDDEEH